MDCVVIIEQPRFSRNSQKHTTHPRTTGLQKNQETDFPNRRADKKLLMNWSPLLRRSLAATKYDNEFITKSSEQDLSPMGTLTLRTPVANLKNVDHRTRITKWWSPQDSTVARFSSPAQRRTPTVLKYGTPTNAAAGTCIPSDCTSITSITVHEAQCGMRRHHWEAKISQKHFFRTPHTLEQRVCKGTRKLIF